MNEPTTDGRADVEPLIRRAFVGPAVAEWARRLGKTLVVSTFEDDDTASANCAVEVVLSVEGPVRGAVTYTLASQTALALAGDTGADGESIDPIPSIKTFFAPLAVRSRELLRSSGAECKVVLSSVKDVRGKTFAGPSSNFPAVHMVSQPTAHDEALPETVSLWFDLTSDRPAVAPESRSSEAPADRQRDSARSSDTGAASPSQANLAPNAPTPVLRTNRLEIVDQSGVARAVVSTLADGSPHIVFADKDGRIRAAISLSKDGQPRLLFLDDMGRRTLDLPQPAHPPHAAHPAAHPSASSQHPQAPRPSQGAPQPARRPNPAATPQPNPPAARPVQRSGPAQPPTQARRPGPPEPPRRP